MKVLRASIKNFRAISELELSFLDELGRDRPIAVLAGPNGSGKTTVLYAIVQALRGVMGYRTPDVPPPSRDDIRLPRSTSGKYITEQPEISVDVLLAFDETEQAAIPELLRKLGDKEAPPKLDDGRLTVRWRYPPGFDRDGTRRNWWNASVEPSKPGIRAWLQARRRVIRAEDPGIRNEFLPQIGGLLFFPQDRNLLDRVVWEGNATAHADSAHDTEDEPSDVNGNGRPVLERSIAEILHYLSDYAKNRVPALPPEQNWEKRIQRLFNEVCAPKEYVGYAWRPDDLASGVPLLREGQQEYPLSHAASGEQIILEYITRLTYPSPHARSVVLIDEPEVHLHPAWVRKLYLALPRIGQNNQYILSSHSAELRQRAAADNALIDLKDWSDAA